jgi:hypothetical protein
VEREEIEDIDSYPEIPTAPEGGWDIRREGHAWTRDEWMLRRDLRPEKMEWINGKLFWCVEHRIAMLGLMLENLGVDAAVRLGDPKVWREAIDRLDAEGGAPPR